MTETNGIVLLPKHHNSQYYTHVSTHQLSIHLLSNTHSLSLCQNSPVDHLLDGGLLRSLPAEHPSRADRHRPGVAAPLVVRGRHELVGLLGSHGDDLVALGEALLVGRLGHQHGDVLPGDVAVVAQVVALLAPRGLGLLAGDAVGRRLDQLDEHVGLVVDVDGAPLVLRVADLDALAVPDGGAGQRGHLHAAGLVWAAPGPEDAGGRDDGGLDLSGVGLAGREDDLVDVAVDGVVGKAGELRDAVPVVEELV